MKGAQRTGDRAPSFGLSFLKSLILLCGLYWVPQQFDFLPDLCSADAGIIIIYRDVALKFVDTHRCDAGQCIQSPLQCFGIVESNGLIDRKIHAVLCHTNHLNAIFAVRTLYHVKKGGGKYFKTQSYGEKVRCKVAFRCCAAWGDCAAAIVPRFPEVGDRLNGR